MGTQKQLSNDSDDEQEEQPTAFEIPDTTRTLDALTEALQAEHQKQEESEDKDNKNKKKQRQGGTICICERPGCGIGPFMEQS